MTKCRIRVTFPWSLVIDKFLIDNYQALANIYFEDEYHKNFIKKVTHLLMYCTTVFKLKNYKSKLLNAF